MLMSETDDLQAAAYSALLSQEIVLTQEEYERRVLHDSTIAGGQVDPIDLHRALLVGINPSNEEVVNTNEQCEGGKEDMSLTVRAIDGAIYHIELTDSVTTVADLKHQIALWGGPPVPEQHLIWNEHVVSDDSKTLQCLGIRSGDALRLTFGAKGGGGGKSSVHYIPASARDPRYDYDFTNKTPHKNERYERGGRLYRRPYGFKRIAIKVKGLYPDDVWLGALGNRKDSSAGEWPVSYHGTGKSAAGSIAEEGYKLSKGTRFVFGKGIYSTPDLSVAKTYAKEFKLGGKKYRVILQNRVDSADTKLVPKKVTHVGDYLVTKHETNIRPYGLLVQKV